MDPRQPPSPQMPFNDNPNQSQSSGLAQSYQMQFSNESMPMQPSSPQQNHQMHPSTNPLLPMPTSNQAPSHFGHSSTNPSTYAHRENLLPGNTSQSTATSSQVAVIAKDMIIRNLNNEKEILFEYIHMLKGVIHEHKSSQKQSESSLKMIREAYSELSKSHTLIEGHYQRLLQSSPNLANAQAEAKEKEKQIEKMKEIEMEVVKVTELSKEKDATIALLQQNLLAGKKALEENKQFSEENEKKIRQLTLENSALKDDLNAREVAEKKRKVEEAEAERIREAAAEENKESEEKVEGSEEDEVEAANTASASIQTRSSSRVSRKRKNNSESTPTKNFIPAIYSNAANEFFKLYRSPYTPIADETIEKYKGIFENLRNASNQLSDEGRYFLAKERHYLTLTKYEKIADRLFDKAGEFFAINDEAKAELAYKNAIYFYETCIKEIDRYQDVNVRKDTYLERKIDLHFSILRVKKDFENKDYAYIENYYKTNINPLIKGLTDSKRKDAFLELIEEYKPSVEPLPGSAPATPVSADEEEKSPNPNPLPVETSDQDEPASKTVIPLSTNLNSSSTAMVLDSINQCLNRVSSIPKSTAPARTVISNQANLALLNQPAPSISNSTSSSSRQSTRLSFTPSPFENASSYFRPVSPYNSLNSNTTRTNPSQQSRRTVADELDFLELPDLPCPM